VTFVNYQSAKFLDNNHTQLREESHDGKYNRWELIAEHVRIQTAADVEAMLRQITQAKLATVLVGERKDPILRRHGISAGKWGLNFGFTLRNRHPEEVESLVRIECNPKVNGIL
jgi:hypothetical protein